MRFLTILCLCFVSGNLFSQEVKILPPVTVTSSTNVSQKVAESFDKIFPLSYGDKWFKMNKNYLVKFMIRDQKNTALFKKSGALIYHISYGHEKDLPDDTRQLIKSQYVDLRITTAIHVDQGGRKIWVVNLEDPKKFIIVRVEDGELEEVGNYDLSK